MPPSPPLLFAYLVHRFSRRYEVDYANSLRFNRLDSVEYRYVAEDDGVSSDARQNEVALAGLLAPKILSLKVGAQASIRY